jgi:translation initiation factor IF-3
VKLTVRFRGREITHPEIAQRQLEHLLANVEDLANVEQNPTMEGRNMAAVVGPRPAVLQRLSQERAMRERLQGPDGSSPGHSSPDNALEDDDEDFDDDDDDDDDDDGESNGSNGG